MSRFDLVFEKLLCKINEQEYIEPTFRDNIKALIKVLKNNDYLEQDKSVEQYIEEIIAQPKNVKEIILDTREKSLPGMKVHVAQDSDSESFAVTVINLEKPENQKTFSNTMLETIFEDVVEYIKSVALEGIKPEAAVEELPQEQGANEQPGGGESALPNI